MKLIFVILILASGSIRAGEHNERHAVEQFAIDALYNSGCSRIKMVRGARWSVDKVEDHYIVSGYQLRVECVNKKKLYSVTWAEPTTRVDGRMLEAGDVAGYQILRDGDIVDVAQCCEFITAKPQGLFIRSVDSDGRVSQAVQVHM